MPATEVIRLRVSPEEKEQLRARSSANGTTMSEEIRAALGFAPAAATPAERFSRVLDRARAAQRSSGLPQMSEDDVLAFVDALRKERAAEAVATYA